MFECDTLLDGEDAAAYLRGLGVEDKSGRSFPPSSSSSSSRSMVVNVGTFEIVGLDEGSDCDDGDDDDDENDKNNNGENKKAPFSAPALLSPSDPAYDSELDA